MYRSYVHLFLGSLLTPLTHIAITFKDPNLNITVEGKDTLAQHLKKHILKKKSKPGAWSLTFYAKWHKHSLVLHTCWLYTWLQAQIPLFLEDNPKHVSSVAISSNPIRTGNFHRKTPPLFPTHSSWHAFSQAAVQPSYGRPLLK